MNKNEVQKRVLQNDKPLALSKFSWDEKTRTFSSDENHLVVDFDEMADCTFDTGSGCTFNTGSGCTFNTSFGCTFKTGSNCTFKTNSSCTFDTGSGCTFNTSFGCTFKTNSRCTFDTGSSCTFDTGSDCTFNTSFGCTFKTDSGCTFNTSFGCTFNTGSECVIVRRDRFEVIQPLENESIKTFSYYISGYISKREGENAYYMDIDGKRIEHIIADDILSQVIKKRGNIYHVKNYGSDKITYLIEEDGVYSHGGTLKEARESFMYKIANRDTTQYQSMTLDTILTKEEAIKMYRVITGACEAGTRYFIENILKRDIKKASIREIIELTKGQYNCEKLQEFFKYSE